MLAVSVVSFPPTRGERIVAPTRREATEEAAAERTRDDVEFFNLEPSASSPSPSTSILEVFESALGAL